MNHDVLKANYNLVGRALLVGLHIALPSGRKQDKQVAAEACVNNDAAPESGNFSKLILPKDSLLPLKQHVSAARDYFYTNSLPFMEDGRRFLSHNHFEAFFAEMEERKGKFETLKAAFLGEYPAYIERARDQLGKLFKQDDYATVSKVSEKFDWKLTPEPIPQGKDLRISLADDEIEAMRKDLDLRVERAAKAAQLSLYRRLFEPLKKMVERLSDPKLVFRDSLIGNLKEVCEVIPKLSLDDDLELLKLVDAARQLSIHDPGTLRDDTRVRQEVAERAKELTQSMEVYFPSELGESCAVGMGEVVAA